MILRRQARWYAEMWRPQARCYRRSRRECKICVLNSRHRGQNSERSTAQTNHQKPKLRAANLFIRDQLSPIRAFFWILFWIWGVLRSGNKSIRSASRFCEICRYKWADIFHDDPIFDRTHAFLGSRKQKYVFCLGLCDWCQGSGSCIRAPLMVCDINWVWLLWKFSLFVWLSIIFKDFLGFSGPRRPRPGSGSGSGLAGPQNPSKANQISQTWIRLESNMNPTWIQNIISMNPLLILNSRNEHI